MKIHCIFVRRASQHATERPELVAAIDEDSAVVNPEYLSENEDSALEDLMSGEIESYRLVDVEVPDKALDEIFAAPLPIKATSVAMRE